MGARAWPAVAGHTVRERAPEQAVDAGRRMALRDTPWGTCEFAFYDLNGNASFFYRDLQA
jgi:uncharacterized glyoxalase superfamily protein PhnB